MPSFNLVDEPWVPVRYRGETGRRFVGLRTAFADQQRIEAVVGPSPLATFSLYRLLLAIAHRAIAGPRDMPAWTALLARGEVEPAAVFAYLSTQRAKRAEAVAQQSRVQAETLLGYLTVNLARELESSGRLDVIASLAKREVDYFHGLPEELKGPETQRTAAEALTQYARSVRRLGDLDGAAAAAEEAEQTLEALRKGGDSSEATIVDLARALDTGKWRLHFSVGVTL